MTSLNVQLSEAQKAFLSKQAAALGCSAEQLVSEIIGHFQKSREKATLEGMLSIGMKQLRKGLGRIITDADWEDMLQKLEKGKKPRTAG